MWCAIYVRMRLNLIVRNSALHYDPAKRVSGNLIGGVVFDWLDRWYLKGEFDKHKDVFSIIVTGSARLDVYRKGGDSLLGRYHSYRLHPFSVAEASGVKLIPVPLKEIVFTGAQDKVFKKLFDFGGFPEVYLKHDQRALRRWHNERVDLLVKQDIVGNII